MASKSVTGTALVISRPTCCWLSRMASEWYSTLFGGKPQARPMDGLLEWHLAGTFGVQVWLDPSRAGKSAMVIDESDLDALAARLDEMVSPMADRSRAAARGC